MVIHTITFKHTSAHKYLSFLYRLLTMAINKMNELSSSTEKFSPCQGTQLSVQLQ